MARRLPNNELVVYPDAGHGGILQFHERFVEKALEFLAKERREVVRVPMAARAFLQVRHSGGEGNTVRTRAPPVSVAGDVGQRDGAAQRIRSRLTR